MRYLIFAYLCTIATAFYTDVDEKLDLVKVLGDSVEIHKYIDCFLDKTPCTDPQLSYKKHFNEAINDACAQCTPSQKHIVEEFIKVMLVKYPDDLMNIKKKYDPEGSHFQRLMTELAKF